MAETDARVQPPVLNLENTQDENRGASKGTARQW
jgi:hypothetical protein